MNKQIKKMLTIGGSLLALVAIVSVGLFAVNGSQLQGYLPNLDLSKQKMNVNRTDFNVLKNVDRGNITCVSEVKDSNNAGYKTVSWKAQVKNATPNPSPDKGASNPYSTDETNPYHLVWFLDDCGKKSTPSGWEGTGIQIDCPAKQGSAKIQVVASFKEANNKNNVATCNVNW
jgi:hypothetical protein